MVAPPHGLQPDLKVVPDVNTDEEATLCAPNASDALQGWPSAAAVHQAPVAVWAPSQDPMEQSWCELEQSGWW
jgi:hypothetical protein